MKKYLFFLSLITLSICAFAQEKIRIACVGNSITYGAGLENRAQTAYPAQLQYLLGNNYAVLNFGHSGATILKKSINPYAATKAYQDALASKPNIVLIKLGTNDAKGPNRGRYGEFEADYKALIASFRNLPTKPRIILLEPVPSFLNDTTSIADTVIKTRIIPMIEHVAFTEKLEMLNLHPLLIDQQWMFPDKIHPNALGAGIIANRIYETVVQKTENNFDVFSKISAEKTISNFHGYECAAFKLNGRDCKVVKPKITAPGHPWIWVARFWGYEPQLDISLLERGFHVAYCDAAELFGNAEAISLWNNFYNLMQQAGLAKKVAFEAISRGGVYTYNWAVANPDKVACVYGGVPVLNLTSWPANRRFGDGKETWASFKKDYNLTEDQALNFKNSPLDHAEKIAKLGFPMLHIVGDADTIVPPAKNTLPFEKRVLTAGGDIQVIHKPGFGHQPVTFPNPTTVTNFILLHTGQKVNFATVPSPSGETRQEAGWSNTKGWWGQFQSIDSLLQATPKLDILFLGNSISQGMGGHRPTVSYRPGFKAFDSVFVNTKWETAGISGDRTQNVLWRLQNGKYKQNQPKVMVLTIGVNNAVSGGDSPKETVAGINTITHWVVKNMPKTKLILLGPLAFGTKKDEQKRKNFEEIHRFLAAEKHIGYTYSPIIKPFLQANGDLNPKYYSTDGIHLIPEGYKVWAKELKAVIGKL